MKISVVTTMYYSAPYLQEFYKRIKNIIKRINDFNSYEIIFVNDGSPDNSLEIALDLYRKDKQIKIIDLSRNFGHHKAIMTGLFYAKGDYIFLIDCDLEEQPEWLEIFYNRIIKSKNKDIDVIFGKQEKRKGRFFEKKSGALFYKIFNFLSDSKIPENIVTARLMTKKFVSNLIKFVEYDLYFHGIAHTIGFSQFPVSVKKLYRDKSTYTIIKRIRLAVNAILSFSSKPLVYIFYIGFFTSFISLFFVFYFIIKKLIFYTPITGWTSLVVSIWFLSGLMLLSIGITGIYVAKIFIQTKNRPYTIINKIYEK